MLKRLLLISCMFCAPLFVFAQETLSAREMVAITPRVAYGLDLPEAARASLEMKLMQMVTQNGFGSTSGEFVLTANVVVIDKQVTRTVPQQYVVDVEVSCYVVNVTEQVVINEFSFEVQGVSRIADKALIQAIKEISPKTTKVRAFMDVTRSKIIEYYNTRIPSIITKAQSLADRAEYDEALYVLSSVPESVDQYPMVADQMVAIFSKKVNHDADAAILKAQGLMANKDYDGALDALLNIDPLSTGYTKAGPLIDMMRLKIEASDEAELEQKMKQAEENKDRSKRLHDDTMTLAKLAIAASVKVGAESAKSQDTLSEGVNSWFLAKFR